MKIVIHKKTSASWLGLVLAVCLMSCGGGSQESGSAADGSAGGSEAMVVEDNVVKLTIGGSDQMRFDKTELRARAGMKVELTLKHTGTLSEAAMGHNVVILKSGTDVHDFAGRAMGSPGNDYIPVDGDEVIANTEMIGGGESSTITFDAPAAGTYDFICTFPGHYGLMKGKFIVE
ncbi:MAG: azurin [Bacteroidota bacterium]